jgi:hypothetical protein
MTALSNADRMYRDKLLFEEARRHKPSGYLDPDRCAECDETWPCLPGQLVEWIDENVQVGPPIA